MASYDAIAVPRALTGTFGAMTRPAAAKTIGPDPYGAVAGRTVRVPAPGARGCILENRTAGGHIGPGFGDDNLFARIWFTPTGIEAGFIVGDQQHTLSIWNAWQDQVVELSGVTVTGGQGTHLDMRIPDRIPATGQATGTLTVLAAGPPLQSSRYVFVIAGADHLLSVSGMRVITLAMEPDWGSDLVVDYIFDTVMASNRRLYEQRRPLLPQPVRRLKAAYLAADIDRQMLVNLAAYGHDKVFGVPVYTEGFRAAALAAGTTTITAAEDIGKFWNLQNLSRYLMIVDHDQRYAEIKRIVSLAGGQVELDQGLGRDFDPQRAVVYPVVLGVLNGAVCNTAAPHVDIITLDFEEFAYGQ